jgi:16S rRNA (uracil1498-N3)-methyltransferase
MDWIVEKAIDRRQVIAPLQCERSVIKLTRSSDQDRAHKRLAHWKGIIQAACEQQCDRTILATLRPIQNFDAYLKEPKSALKLLLSPDATQSLYSVLIENAPQDIILMIGPEGGHSPEERSASTSCWLCKSFLWVNGYSATETAGVVAITAVHSVWNPEMQKRLG